MIFLPKKLKNWCLYNIFPKSKIKRTTALHVVEPCLDIWHAKYQVDISIFDKHIAQNLYPLMTLFFQTVILSISRHCTDIKITFLESSDQPGSETHIFIRRSQFGKLTLCDPGLTHPFSVVNLHGVRLQYGLDFWVIRAKVAINNVLHAKKTFFLFLWPFVTWPWPWLVLSMALMLRGYLRQPFQITLAGISSKSYWYCRL